MSIRKDYVPRHHVDQYVRENHHQLTKYRAKYHSKGDMLVFVYFIPEEGTR